MPRGRTSFRQEARGLEARRVETGTPGRPRGATWTPDSSGPFQPRKAIRRQT
jgi:hypothetical protein